MEADFVWITVQILFPLFKLNNLGLFEGEISENQILKNLSSPSKKVFRVPAVEKRCHRRQQKFS